MLLSGGRSIERESFTRDLRVDMRQYSCSGIRDG